MPYTLQDRLGVGLMGEVRRALHGPTRTPRALKLLTEQAASNAGIQRRLHRLVEISARLQHAHLLRYHELGRMDDGRWFLAMDLLQGESLEDRMFHAPLPLDEAVDTIRQAAEGLQAAHRGGTMHGALNPAAIFLDGARGSVRTVVTDLGLSAWSDVADQQPDELSVVSAKYLAPEQIRGGFVDGRADVFALGILLYEMVTGEEPFPVEDPVLYSQANCTAFFRKACQVRPKVPVLLSEIIDRMLARELTVRYDVAGLLRDLYVAAREVEPERRKGGSSARIVKPPGPARSGPAPPVETGPVLSAGDLNDLETMPEFRIETGRPALADDSPSDALLSDADMQEPAPPAKPRPHAPRQAPAVPVSGRTPAAKPSGRVRRAEAGASARPPSRKLPVRREDEPPEPEAVEDPAGEDLPFALTSRRVRAQRKVGMAAAIGGGAVVLVLLVWGAMALFRGGASAVQPPSGPPAATVPTQEEIALQREEERRRQVDAKLAEAALSEAAGNWERAGELLEEARILGRNAPEVTVRVEALHEQWKAAARALADGAHHREAADMYRRVARAYPSDTASAALARQEERAALLADGDALKGARDWSGAMAAYQRALDAGEVDARRRMIEVEYLRVMEAAEALEGRGEWEAAAEAYRRAVEVSDLPPARDGEARCRGRLEALRRRAELIDQSLRLREAGDLVGALDRLLDAAGVAIPDEDDLPERLANLGSQGRAWYFDQGRKFVLDSRMEDAAGAFETALKFAPDDKDLEDWLARARSLSGMVYVPAGEFIMGSGQGAYDEAPPRRVRLDHFFIDRTEVSNEQYLAFVVATGRRPPRHWTGGRFPDGEAAQPVTRVNWYDARDYAAWAGKRLPVEAEWERAARGTDGRLWPWGNEFDPSVCNSSESRLGRTLPVDSLPRGASPAGCLHMAGNVGEWVDGLYRPYEGYRGAPVLAFEEDRRVLRGGSWSHDGSMARCPARGHAPPEASSEYDGFRCARDVDW